MARAGVRGFSPFTVETPLEVSAGAGIWLPVGNISAGSAGARRLASAALLVILRVLPLGPVRVTFGPPSSAVRVWTVPFFARSIWSPTLSWLGPRGGVL